MVVVGRRGARRARRVRRAACATARRTSALAPYGGDGRAGRRRARAAVAAVAVLREVGRDRVFLALAGSFFICGATTVGLIAVHLIPAAHDHGIPAGQAAG